MQFRWQQFDFIAAKKASEKEYMTENFRLLEIEFFINSCVNQRFNRMTIVLSPINVYFSKHDDFGNRCAQTIPKFGDEGKRYVRIFHRHICVCLDGCRLWNRLQCIQCVLSTHYHPVTNCFDVYSVVFVVV